VMTCHRMSAAPAGQLLRSRPAMCSGTAQFALVEQTLRPESVPADAPAPGALCQSYLAVCHHSTCA